MVGFNEIREELFCKYGWNGDCLHINTPNPILRGHSGKRTLSTHLSAAEHSHVLPAAQSTPAKSPEGMVGGELATMSPIPCHHQHHKYHLLNTHGYQFNQRHNREPMVSHSPSRNNQHHPRTPQTQKNPKKRGDEKIN